MEIKRQKYIEFDTIDAALSHEPAYDIVQLKYDGIWCRLEVRQDPVHQRFGSWYSRTGDLKTQGPVDLPPGTYLGEFMFGSHWAQHPARNGKTYLFDIVWDGSNDLTQLPYIRRYGILRRRCLQNAAFPVVGNVHRDLARVFWNRVVATGSEGLVFRHSQAGYDDVLGRVKREIEVDYVILDTIEGNGKHLGRLGALVCGLYIQSCLTQVCKVGGGFTDRDRDRLWAARTEIVGRVVRVKGKGQFPSGALRHPNFVGFRDDKRPEDCTWVPTESE